LLKKDSSTKEIYKILDNNYFIILFCYLYIATHTMLSADQTIWDESLNRTPVEKPFIEKQMLYIQDQNNGSYSGL